MYNAVFFLEDIDSFGINVNESSVVNISENIAYCKSASLQYGFLQQNLVPILLVDLTLILLINL